MVTHISHTKTLIYADLTAGSFLYIRIMPAQRSVHTSYCAYQLETQYLTAGSFAIYCMRLYCYDSYTTDPDVMDQLGYCAYSYSALPLGIRFHIREDRLSLALLADCLLVPRPKLDYIL